MTRTTLFLVAWTVLCFAPTGEAGEMPRVAVAKDKKTFVLDPSGRPFTPWGFNYDHDEQGRLLEDYWDSEWPKVEEDRRHRLDRLLLGQAAGRVASVQDGTGCLHAALAGVL